VPAEIFVPALTPAAKVARIASYGAEVVQTARPTRRRWPPPVAQSETGALEVHAYDHPRCWPARAPWRASFEQDAPEVTHVLVATGGGGLIGGMAAGMRVARRSSASSPQPAPPCTMRWTPGGRWMRGRRHRCRQPGCSPVGALMFPLAQRYVSDAVLVPDTAIAAAQRLLWDRFRLVAEPAARPPWPGYCPCVVPPDGSHSACWCAAQYRSRKGGIMSEEPAKDSSC